MKFAMTAFRGMGRDVLLIARASSQHGDAQEDLQVLKTLALLNVAIVLSSTQKHVTTDKRPRPMETDVLQLAR